MRELIECGYDPEEPPGVHIGFFIGDPDIVPYIEIHPHATNVSAAIFLYLTQLEKSQLLTILLEHISNYARSEYNGKFREEVALAFSMFKQKLQADKEEPIVAASQVFAE